MKTPLVVIALICLLAVFAACAPSATPTPVATSKAAASDATTAVTKPTSTPNLDDATWAKTVEAAKKEGKVTLYSFSFTGDLGIAISKPLKEKYGITVDLITGSGSQLVPRLESEYRAGQYVADLLEGSLINAIFAKQRGLTGPYGYLPELQKTDPWIIDMHFDKDGHILPYTYAINGPWINTNLLKPGDEPKAWKDLLAPKWKGKMVVTDPDTMPLLNYEYVGLTRYLGLDDSYFQQLGKQGLITMPIQRENDSAVAGGQFPITLTSLLATMAPFVTSGAPVKPIDFSEGIIATPSPSIAFLAKAPRPNAARVFTNWLLSQGYCQVGCVKLPPIKLLREGRL